MTAKEDIKKIALRATEYVKDFFVNLEEDQKKILPPVLKKSGTWMTQYDEASIGFFFLTMDELKRATKNQNKGFPAFPGFIISEDKRPAGIQVWVSVPGTCHFYSSNHTKNMYVFSVKPGDSFIVVDHFQEIRDSSGEEFKYRVDIAFVIGIYPGEEWQKLEKRLSELLDHAIGVWRKLQ